MKILKKTLFKKSKFHYGSPENWCLKETYDELIRNEIKRSFRTNLPLSLIKIQLPQILNNETCSEDIYYNVFQSLIKVISDNLRHEDKKFLRNKYSIELLLINTSIDSANVVSAKIISALTQKYLIDKKYSLHNSLIKQIEFHSYPLNNIAGKKDDENQSAKKDIPIRKVKENPETSTNHTNFLDTDYNIKIIGPNTVAITDTFLSLNYKRYSVSMFEFYKRFFDISAAIFGILFFSLLMFLIAIIIKFTSKGPVIFKQKRIGKGGQPFTFYKFRTMATDNDDRVHREYVASLINGEESDANLGSESKPFYKLKSDNRITKIGKILRKTSLDELPQLFNVLFGKMSLVGPRPALPYEVDIYKNWHLQRVFEVKPGITGLWQVNGRSKTTFDEMVRFDLKYIKNRSALLDIKIALKTALVMLVDDGAK